MIADRRIIEPGEIEAPVGKIPFLFLPPRDLFARRAERLRSLAKGHRMGEYLEFAAKLAEAQQEALDQFSRAPLPGPDAQALCHEQGAPFLDARSRPLDPAWRTGLTTILRRMTTEEALPPAARETVNNIMQASGSALDERADRVLAGDLNGIPPQEMPFVAAALQVQWVRMALHLKENAVGRPEPGGLCPVCGSHPNVGIVRGSGTERGLRYLSCSLCSSQWHFVRLKCSNCDSTEGIDYHTVQGSNARIKAESCDKCNSYLKLLYLKEDPQMEAVADDLATLGLDMLMDNEGKARRGPNLFLHPGRRH